MDPRQRFRNQFAQMGGFHSPQNITRRFINTNNNAQLAQLLGPLMNLPGTWQNEGGLEGRGWNMIALPSPSSPHRFRLLCNQYNEVLKFSNVADIGVPNRGGFGGDQTIAALDYEQMITQIAAADSPSTGLAGSPGLGIHHEPGLFLHIMNHETRNMDIARQAAIPHGNQVMMMGSSQFLGNRMETLMDVTGTPLGFDARFLQSTPYLEPYKHFHDNLFEGLFDPVFPVRLLNKANEGIQFQAVTKLQLSTKSMPGSTGVLNIPFINQQARVVSVESTFWIQTLAARDARGQPQMRLQYMQNVMIQFLGILWPHVSINTMRKAS